MRRSKRLDEIEVEALLNGEHERSNAILAVNVGATRMEAQDWAKVLQRMCLRWAKFGGVRGGILAPCRLVKDLLSQLEVDCVDRVLDGDLGRRFTRRPSAERPAEPPPAVTAWCSRN